MLTGPTRFGRRWFGTARLPVGGVVVNGMMADPCGGGRRQKRRGRLGRLAMPGLPVKTRFHPFDEAHYLRRALVTRPDGLGGHGGVLRARECPPELSA